MYPPEVEYDFVTTNWTKTYPTSTQIGGLPDELPLKVGDTWYEGGPEGEDKLTTWHVAIAMRPTLFVFNSVGRLRHDRNGDGGREGRITVQYHFTCPGPDITLFTRTMTIEAYRYAPLPDKYFMMVNPANIDAYHAAIAGAGGVSRRMKCHGAKSAEGAPSRHIRVGSS